MSAGPGEDAAGADLAVPLHSRRQKRAQFAQKLQHVVPASGLVISGVQSLKSGADGLELVLAVAGIITSALLITAFARTARGLRTPTSADHLHLNSPPAAVTATP